MCVQRIWYIQFMLVVTALFFLHLQHVNERWVLFGRKLHFLVCYNWQKTVHRMQIQRNIETIFLSISIPYSPSLYRWNIMEKSLACDDFFSRTSYWKGVGNIFGKQFNKICLIFFSCLSLVYGCVYTITTVYHISFHIYSHFCYVWMHIFGHKRRRSSNYNIYGYALFFHDSYSLALKYFISRKKSCDKKTILSACFYLTHSKLCMDRHIAIRICVSCCSFFFHLVALLPFCDSTWYSTKYVLNMHVYLHDFWKPTLCLFSVQWDSHLFFRNDNYYSNFEVLISWPKWNEKLFNRISVCLCGDIKRNTHKKRNYLSDFIWRRQSIAKKFVQQYCTSGKCTHTMHTFTLKLRLYGIPTEALEKERDWVRENGNTLFLPSKKLY